MLPGVVNRQFGVEVSTGTAFTFSFHDELMTIVVPNLSVIFLDVSKNNLHYDQFLGIQSCANCRIAVA